MVKANIVTRRIRFDALSLVYCLRRSCRDRSEWENDW